VVAEQYFLKVADLKLRYAEEIPTVDMMFWIKILIGKVAGIQFQKSFL
jgi:hypothetical protein